jgi:Mce-associated membrane protein
MADDAATPEGELSEPTEEQSTASPDEVSESPKATDPTAATETKSETSESAATPAVTSHARPKKPKKPKKPGTPMSRVRVAAIVGVVVIALLAGLVGWLGFQSLHSQRAQAQRELFLQVGRQAAINLTTIDFQHADADVQRILDSATDTFYDDFSKRSQPFVNVVKQAQSKSEGTVTAAGLESDDANEAQVLVAVTVKTSNAGAAEQQPRAWRMRIAVKKVGDDAKVANVEFVP